MMKKFFLLIALIAMGLASYAQSTPNRLVVTMKNGDITVYNIADIDSLSFDLIEGEVVATPTFLSFEWDGDNGIVNYSIAKSEAASNYSIVITNGNVEEALVDAPKSNIDGESNGTITSPTPGTTYTIATLAYDKYGMPGTMATATFVVPEKSVELPAVKINIPDDFTSCMVQRVMLGDVKVAELCEEYIKELGERRVIVYPCDAQGRAILTKGVSATDSGTAVWDLEANTCTYTAGNSTALSTVYLVDGEIVIDAPATVEEGTVEPDLLVDIRGSEENTYKIVKIGTQYWLAENLRAAKWIDGTAIEMFKSTQGSAWNANTTGAYHVYADDNDYISIFGMLYNGYCVEKGDQLAPEGWEIPSIDQWRKVRTYGGPAATNFKSDTDYSWNMGKEGTNLNGFNAWAAGYFSTATGDTSDGSDAWFWSTTPYSEGQSFQTLRINQSSTNLTLYTTSGHAYNFGHSIRCVRK